MRDWDNVVEFYNSFLDDKRYADYGTAMLELVNRLRDHPAFTHLQRGTAHMVLFFVVPNTTRNVHVFVETPGKFEVFLDHCGEGNSSYGEKSVVEAENVISVLLDYLERIQPE